jgi:hypothetical protein
VHGRDRRIIDLRVETQKRATLFLNGWFHGTEPLRETDSRSSPCAMKTYWEWEYRSMHSLTSTLERGEWLASGSGRFTPGGRGTHCIGGCMGPRADLEAVEKRKTSSSRREWNPRTPIVQPVASRYNDWTTPALIVVEVNKNSLPLMEPKGFSSYTQNSATVLYSEPVVTNSHPHILSL